MALVPVSQLKPGSTLRADVVTPLGGLLFEKGSKIFEREIEILLAFFIEEVMVEEPHPQAKMFKTSITPSPEPLVLSQPQEEPITFEQQFQRTVKFYKEMFKSVQGGLPIALRELTEHLTELVKFPSEVSYIFNTITQSYPIEDYTYFHSISVSYLSVCLARWSRIEESEMLSIALAGALHDIGKSKISPEILNKTEQLSLSEKTELRKYPVYGYHLVKAVNPSSDSILLGVLQHQEREDGSGYPLGLPSSSIHPYAKLVAISDIFHAMCSSKSYKAGSSPYVVLEQLLSDSFGKLDPHFVRLFVDGMTQFSLGMEVELSDGTQGKIIYVDRSQPTRPMVEVQGNIINLMINRHVYIKRAII